MRECYGRQYYHNGRMFDCPGFDTHLIFEGESVYEVIRVMEGIPLFFEDHLQRFHQTLSLRDIKSGQSDDEITDAVRQVILGNNIQEGNIKIIFNFDPGHVRSSHLLVYRVEHFYPAPEMYARGVKCTLYQAERPQPTAKIIYHTLRLTIYNKLIETGMYEALLVNRRGYITEGSRSNVFFIRDNTIYTAPDTMVLPGISRGYVIRICRELSVPLQMKAVHLEELPGMDALFLTGTSIKVLPVNTVDEHTFPPSHRLIHTLGQEYDKVIDDYIKNHKS